MFHILLLMLSSQMSKICQVRCLSLRFFLPVIANFYFFVLIPADLGGRQREEGSEGETKFCGPRLWKRSACLHPHQRRGERDVQCVHYSL